MGEKIEFPNNYSMYLKKAEQYLNLNEPIKALHYIELAYDIKQEPNINTLYVSVLVQLERYSEALEIFEDIKDENIMKTKYVSLYLFLLIKNKRFIQAETYLTRLTSGDQLSIDELSQMKILLEEEILIDEMERHQAKNELKKKLFALADLSREEQLKIVDEVSLLTPDELIKANPFIMSNPFVDPLAKSFYLQNLVAINADVEFEFETLGITKIINPSKLDSFNEESIVVQVNEQLDMQLEKNPSMLMSIKPELNFHLLKIYPFAKQVIENPVEWVKLYIHLYSFETENLEFDSRFSAREKKMMEWIKKLSEMEG